MRRQPERLKNLFSTLLAHHGEVAAQDALQALSASVQLTEYEKAYYESGGRRFERIVRFVALTTVV